jgi:SEC-C motif-containing protein
VESLFEQGLRGMDRVQAQYAQLLELRHSTFSPSRQQRGDYSALSAEVAAQRSENDGVRRHEQGRQSDERRHQRWPGSATRTSSRFEPMSKRRHGFPSETHVKRGERAVKGGEKELEERLGGNDPCPCGSGRRFQALLP